MNKEVMKPQALNNLEKDWRGKHEKESCQSIIYGVIIGAIAASINAWKKHSN
ncbi:MAG: hypothetical protein ACLUUG_05850 [Lachnospiraceae bacterium]|jgi:hypothetical protein|nr:hypothetical protein [Dorea sp.]